MANITWAADASGYWNVAARWSGGKVPGQTDSVTLTSHNPSTIFYNTSDAVASLASTDDTLDIESGALTVTGGADLGGRLAQTGGTLTLLGSANTLAAATISAGNLVLGSGAALTINGTTALGSASGTYGARIHGAATVTTTGLVSILEDGGNTELYLGGALSWRNAGQVNDAGIVTAAYNAGTAFTITNQYGAVFNFTTDVACLMNGMAEVNGKPELAGSKFFNNGLIEKTGGTGTTTFYCAVDNTGTIAVDSGTLALEGGGMVAGTLEGTGILAFAAGSFTLGAKTAEHLDRLQLKGATLDVTGAISSAQTIGFLAPSTLEIAAPNNFQAALSGLGVGDKLDFTSLAGATATASGTTLTVQDGGEVYHYTINSLVAGLTLSAGPDQNGGTEITFHGGAAADPMITLGPSKMAFWSAPAAPESADPFAATTLPPAEVRIAAPNPANPESGYLSLSGTHATSLLLLASHPAPLPHLF
jgi:hypothetical protein